MFGANVVIKDYQINKYFCSNVYYNNYNLII